MSTLKDVTIANADVYIALKCENSDVNMPQLKDAVSTLNEMQSDSDTSVVESIVGDIISHHDLNTDALDYILKNYKFFTASDTINRLRDLMTAISTKGGNLHVTEVSRIAQLEMDDNTTVIRPGMASWEYLYISMLLKQCQSFNNYNAVVAIRDKLGEI
ncbi:MAG: hypothetical protein NC489_08250 [Ruminococcus flavefaciens]|nr:hypothetical protein [Ruminococcus flavefaciens]